MSRKHEPTDEQRKTVEAMSSFGITQEDISRVIGVDKKTLIKYYRDELDTATAKANAQVAGRLFQKCLDGDTASMIFWMKTRARWSEKIELDHSGKLDIHNILAGIDEQRGNGETEED